MHTVIYVSIMEVGLRFGQILKQLRGWTLKVMWVVSVLGGQGIGAFCLSM